MTLTEAQINENFAPLTRPSNFIDFEAGWMKLLDVILTSGTTTVFGSENEVKVAKEIPVAVVWEQEAVAQMLALKMPKHYQYGEKSVREYVKKCLKPFAEEQRELSDEDNAKFDYTYVELLYDQLDNLRDSVLKQKETGIQSNRNQALTWDKNKNSFKDDSPPCLQIIWIKWHPGDLLDVHIVWRSRDAWHALPSNMAGITNMINEYVAIPTGCKIRRVVEYIFSLHIYEAFLDDARLAVRTHKETK
jgi:thymidylate synthase